MKHPIRAGFVVLTCLAATPALSGCGVTGTDFRPGVAADVGDTSVRLSDVDDVVTGACAFLADLDDSDAQVRSTFRQSIAQTLVQREAMEQLLDEQGVEQPVEYTQALASIQDGTADLPDDQQEPLRTANEASVYVQFGEIALGQAAAGVVAGDDGAAQTAGAQQLADWINDRDVEVNPVFGFTADDVTVEQQLVDQASTQTTPVLTFPSSDDISVPAGTRAVLALPVAAGEQPSEEQTAYVASLPPNQTCG